MTADFAAAAAEPLPATAARLRAALTAAATERLGLVVAEVDLRVTALLDEDAGGRRRCGRLSRIARRRSAGTGDEGRARGAALAVPGVARLTGVAGPAVHIEERHAEGALPRRHARVELAVDADHRALDVAREVRRRLGRRRTLTVAYRPPVAVTAW